MPKNNMRRKMKMRGGFDFSTMGSSFKNWGTGIGTSFSGWWNKDKNQTIDTSYTPTTDTQQSYSAPSTEYNTDQNNSTNYPMNNTMGGKKRRNTQSKRGGFKSNTPTTGLASHAGLVSGLATARAHNLVGGKTKRHRHRHSKTCRHRKH